MFESISLAALIVSGLAMGVSCAVAWRSLPSVLHREVQDATSTAQHAMTRAEAASDRVEAIRMNVDAVLEQARDSLDAAERKRRSAAQAERRHAQQQAAEGGAQVDPTDRHALRALVYGQR